MIEGPRLYLRALEPDDTELLYQWENDTSLWRVSNTFTPFSRFTLEQYVMNSHQDIFAARQLRLMVMLTETDTAVGTIDLFDFDPLHKRAGIGIMILEKFRKQGYAWEALDIMISYCFDTLLLHQLYCNIAADNEDSIELFLKSGFTVIGNKKQWLLDKSGFHDELMLQLIHTVSNV